MVGWRGFLRAGAAGLLVIVGGVACGGSSETSQRLVIDVTGAAERASILIEVSEGDETRSDEDLPYRREVDVTGDFAVVVTARSLDGADLACSVGGLADGRTVEVNPSLGDASIELGGPLESPSAPAVRCAVTGSVDGSSLSFDSSASALDEGMGAEAGAAGDATNAEVAVVATEGDLDEVADPTGWFRVLAPVSWDVDLFAASPDPSCTNVDAGGSLEHPDDSIGAELSIGLWACEPAPAPVAQWLEQFVAAYLEGAELVSDTEEVVAGHDARVVRATTPSGGEGALYGIATDAGFLLVEVHYPGATADPRYDALVELLADSVVTGPLG